MTLEDDRHPHVADSIGLIGLEAEVLAELARIDFARHDLKATLERVAAVAARTLPGAEQVSMTLIRGANAFTVATTGEIALALDESQYRAGHGPCMDAARGAEVQLITDMATETRWPDYATTALEHGIAASLSLPIPVQDTVVAALNVYAREPDAFDPGAIELGRQLADYAAVAVTNAYLYHSAATDAAQLREAMENRAVIEQAKGIIMGARGCNAQEAFEVLRHLSNTTNRKLREVAAFMITDAHTRRPPQHQPPGAPTPTPV